MKIANQYLIYERGANIEKIQEIITQNKLKGLIVQSFLNENLIEDFNFLNECNFLESLIITTRIDPDYGFLGSLKKLKHLKIFNEGSNVIDFSKQEKLEFLDILWRKTINNWSACRSLKEVCLWNWRDKVLPAFATPSLLEVLDIRTASINDFTGLSNLVNLRDLAIRGCRNLQTFDAGKLLHLEKVVFEACNKLEFADLGEFPFVKTLEIIDCKKIPSLQFLSKFPKLTELSIYGNIKILDEDFSYIAHIPKVRIPKYLERKKK